MTQKKQVKTQTAPQALKDETLDKAAGGGKPEPGRASFSHYFDVSWPTLTISSRT